MEFGTEYFLLEQSVAESFFKIPQRSVSDNTLVAMDFSGCTGRVIENPNEALTVALEEAQAWRVSLLFGSCNTNIKPCIFGFQFCGPLQKCQGTPGYLGPVEIRGLQIFWH